MKLRILTKQRGRRLPNEKKHVVVELGRGGAASGGTWQVCGVRAAKKYAHGGRWQSQQVSNAWVKLIFVPQNGGRLMQVIFDGHPFLFVNQRLAGKYLPPSSTEWFNYGGDKLWGLPEGTEDEHH